MLSLLLVFLAAAGPAAPAETVTVTVLATTDTHGHLYPWDYFTKEKAARGLAAASTLVEQVRRETPNVVLLDCGDTIQGSALESVHQAAVRDGRTSAPDPMMLAMNAMGYDAMVVGNHEFNVAVVGVTTAAIPQWEKPEQIAGLSWLDPVEGVRAALLALDAEKPDVVLAAVHGGLDRDPQTGERRAGEKPGENSVWEIAEAFPQLAAIVYGHTHRREEGRRVGNVLLVQPRNWAQEVARIDLTLSREKGGRWTLARAESRLVPVLPDTPADPRVLEIARPYHEAAERYLEQPVAESPAELSGQRARFEDTALVDAIQEVQLHYAKADVSLSSLFRPQTRVPRGPVTVRELAGLYVYDNELYAVEGTGRMVREALENAARYFRTCPEPTCATGPLVDRAIAGYNSDLAQGVEYEIDLTQPVGQRVKSLRYRGAPLRDDQALRIAVNNYRAAGSSGYTMFREAKVLWRSGREIRDLMVDYFTAKKRLPEKPDGNWRLVPPLAVETLAREEPSPR